MALQSRHLHRGDTLSYHNAAALTRAQMVQPSQVMQVAKPLPQQRVDKGRVWGVTVIGAASLFLITLTIENYDAWFPAISKANKASSEMKKAMEVSAAAEVGSLHSATRQGP